MALIPAHHPPHPYPMSTVPQGPQPQQSRIIGAYRTDRMRDTRTSEKGIKWRQGLEWRGRETRVLPEAVPSGRRHTLTLNSKLLF